MKNQRRKNMLGILKVIKYEGDNSTFVWKHPAENFNTGSQLIVHETQEAVFFNNGQALDLFEPGRYTLKTQNIPLLRTAMSLPTGGKTPFHSEVYFINKTQQMSIKWGTDNQVQYMEPTYNFPLQIGASGEMVVSVSDSRRLLVKIVGTEKRFTQQDLTVKFRAFLMSKIKPYLASSMQNSGFSIFEIDSHMDELSSDLQELLYNDFDEYGLKLEHFFVTNIAKPVDDPAYIKFKDLHARQYSEVVEAQLKQKLDIIEQQTEAQKMVIESSAIAQKRAQENYTYQQERGFEVAQDVANNEAIGQFTNMGVGFGTMAGIGGAVGGVVGNAVNNAFDSVNHSKQSNDDMSAFSAKLDKLVMMKEKGLLSDEEFAVLKKNLIESI